MTFTIRSVHVGMTQVNMWGELRHPFSHAIRPKDVGKRFTKVRGKLVCLSANPL